MKECKNPFKFSSTDLTDYSRFSSQVNIGKCNLTNEGLDTSVALRGSDNSALMYDREKTQDILKEIINSEGIFKLRGGVSMGRSVCLSKKIKKAKFKLADCGNYSGKQ